MRGQRDKSGLIHEPDAPLLLLRRGYPCAALSAETRCYYVNIDLLPLRVMVQGIGEQIT